MNQKLISLKCVIGFQKQILQQYVNKIIVQTENSFIFEVYFTERVYFYFKGMKKAHRNTDKKTSKLIHGCFGNELTAVCSVRDR